MSLRLFGILFFFTSFLFSQTIIIRDKNTAEPLPMVAVISTKPIAYTISNAKGQADVSEFKKSTHIEISILGYKTETLSYTDLEELKFQIWMTPSVLNMDEIVISATKWSQHSDDIPAKIISISNNLIQLQNPQTAADLLNVSGKVFIQKSQQGGGSPMIRGFATNRLLYSFDGVRMNTAIFRAGNIQNVISIDPFAIEKTEIFFGPGSVIYGSDAIGGVMSFQSLTPQFSLSEHILITGKANTRFSSINNEKTAHFDVNVGWNKWALVSSISSNDFDDLKMGSHGPDEYLRPYYVGRIDNKDVVLANENNKIQTPTAYSQINLMQKIRFMPNDKWDFQYGFHFSETSDYARYDRHLREKNGIPRYGEWNYGPQKWSMNNLYINRQSKNALFEQMSFRLTHQYFQESRISRNFNSSLREIQTEKVNAWSSNFDFIKSVGKQNKIIYGLEWVLNDVNSYGKDTDIINRISKDGPTRYPQSDWSSWAIYITDQFKFSNKFNIEGGLRYNRFIINADFDTTFYPFPYSSTHLNNGALSGSLGLVWHPKSDLTFSFNTSSAFRSPNIDDLGKVFDSADGIVVVPNPDLDPEYAYNIDFGVAKMFGKNLKIDLTTYYTYLNHAMVRRDYKFNGEDFLMYNGEMSRVQALQNAAFASVMGLQAGLEIKLLNGIGFSTDINIQKGEEEQDNGTTSPSRHAPPTYGMSKLTYNYQKLNMQFYALYSGQKDNDEMPEEEKDKPEIYAIDSNGKPYSPSWYTLNFKANYQLADYLSVGSGIENITDQRYKTYSSGISSPGRNFIFSLKAIF